MQIYVISGHVARRRNVIIKQIKYNFNRKLSIGDASWKRKTKVKLYCQENVRNKGFVCGLNSTLFVGSNEDLINILVQKTQEFLNQLRSYELSKKALASCSYILCRYSARNIVSVN